MYFPRLKDLRNDMDLRQVEVAELLHIRQTVYSRYERGDRTIPVEHLLIPPISGRNRPDFSRFSPFYP